MLVVQVPKWFNNQQRYTSSMLVTNCSLQIWPAFHEGYEGPCIGMRGAYRKLKLREETSLTLNT